MTEHLLHSHNDSDDVLTLDNNVTDLFNEIIIQQVPEPDQTHDVIKESMPNFYAFHICIFKDDHLPPHFHVCSEWQSAAFLIETGERWPGSLGLDGKDDAIKILWKLCCYEILDHWNDEEFHTGRKATIDVTDYWPQRYSTSEIKKRAELLKDSFLEKWGKPGNGIPL